MKLQHTRKTLGILSWVFKEDDYSIVIGYSSPCSGGVSSLLKPTWHYRRLQTEQVVLKSKDSRSKLPLVSNFYMRLNDFKTAIGDELLHQCEQYKPTQQVKAEHQCVKYGHRTGYRHLNPHLVPKDAINAFELRPHKNKLNIGIFQPERTDVF